MTTAEAPRIVREARVGPIRLTLENGFLARMTIDDHPWAAWSWPTQHYTGDPKLSFAEELATALSFIDGRFEVRRLRNR